MLCDNIFIELHVVIFFASILTRSDLLWMYNRWMPMPRAHTPEILAGVKQFITVASGCQEFLNEGKISCPCCKCQNCCFLDVSKVKEHLYRKGFMPNYYQWTSHGEAGVHNEPESSFLNEEML
jgi:hypothetical protein